MHPSDSRPRRVSGRLLIAIWLAFIAVPGMWSEAALARILGADEIASFDIPSGPLGRVLNEFAARTGVAFAGSALLTEGKSSGGLRGSYRVEEGFELILRGTGLLAERRSDGMFVLKSAAVTPVELSPVVVHASFPDDPLEERMSLTAAKIIIGPEELQRHGDASMGDVIRRMPSVSFGGPPGENNDARIRGMGKEYTQILIDGQPVPGRDFAIDQIPARLVERIEIIRSTTANSDNQGIAGSVNIVLKKLQKERTASWNVGAGMMPDAPGDGTMGNADFSYGDGTENFRYQIDANVQNRFGVRIKDRQDFNNGGSVLTNREKDFEVREHSEKALSGRLQWQLNDNDSFRLDPRYMYSSEDKERDRLKKAGLTDAERMDQVKTREYYGLNGQWQRKLGQDERYTLGFNLQRVDIQTDKTERKGAAGTPFDALPTFASGNDDHVRENALSLRASTQQRINKTHALEFGAELHENDWRSEKNGWKSEDGSDLVRTVARVIERKFAAYVQDEILIGERHVLTPGLRVEHVQVRSRTQSERLPGASDTQVSPSVHWLSTLDDATNWRASLTRSIRRPKFDDIAAQTTTQDGTLDKPDKTGNPALKPEQAWAIETSLERYFHDRSGVASINLFHRHLEDLIEKRIGFDGGSGRYTEQPVNVDRARTWGVELDGSYRFRLSSTQEVTVRGNYSWLDSKTRDVSTGRNRRINDQPEYILNLGVDYKYQPWKSTFGMHYNRVGRLQKADLAGSNFRVQRQRPSEYLDAYVRVELAKNLHLRLTAQNLLEAEKIRPRTTTRPDGTVALFEQEDEASSRAFFVQLEGRF